MLTNQNSLLLFYSLSAIDKDVQGDQESNGIYEGYIQSFEKTNDSITLNVSGLIGNVPVLGPVVASSSAPSQEPSHFSSKVQERNVALTKILNTLKTNTEVAEEKIKERSAKLSELKAKLSQQTSVNDLKAENSKLSERYEALAISVADTGTKREEAKKSAEESTKQREDYSCTIGKLENKIEVVKSSLFTELAILQENTKTITAAAEDAVSKAEAFKSTVAATDSKLISIKTLVAHARLEKDSVEKALTEAQIESAAKKKELEAAEQAFEIAKKDLEQCAQRASEIDNMKKSLIKKEFDVTRETSNHANISMALESKACELVDVRSRIAQLNGHLAAQRHVSDKARKLHQKLISGDLLQLYENASMRAIAIQRKFADATISRTLKIDAKIPGSIQVHPAGAYVDKILSSLGRFTEAVSSIITSSPKVMRECFSKDSSIETTFEALTSLVEWTKASVRGTVSTVNEIKHAIDSMDLASKSMEGISSPTSRAQISETRLAAAEEVVTLKKKSSTLEHNALAAEEALRAETTRFDVKIEQAKAELVSKTKTKKEEGEQRKKKAKDEELALAQQQQQRADADAKLRKAASVKAAAIKPAAAPTPTMASVASTSVSMKRAKQDDLLKEPESDNDEELVAVSRKDKPRKIDSLAQPHPQQERQTPTSLMPSRKSQDVSSAQSMHTGNGILKKRRVEFQETVQQSSQAKIVPPQDDDDNDDEDSIADRVTSHTAHKGGKRAGGDGSPEGGGDYYHPAPKGRADGLKQQPQPLRSVQQSHQQSQQQQQLQRPRASPSASQVSITPAPPRHVEHAVKRATPSTVAYKIPTPSSTAPHGSHKVPTKSSNFSMNNIFEDMG